jgi:DNA-binding response OmpR family regulator
MSTEILLVTDQPDIGQFWAYTLEQRGHVCVEASPKEQLSGAKYQGWSAALVDLYGPDAQPIQVCETLRRQSDSPILLLWDAHDEGSILQAYEAGVAEVVQRPISPLLLAAKLEAWLRRTRMAAADAIPDDGASTDVPPLGRTAGSGR